MTTKFKIRTWKNGGGTFGAYIYPVVDGAVLDHCHHRINDLLSKRAARSAAFQIVRKLRTQRLFLVDVTKSDINNGNGRDCRSCAIARALNRVLPTIGYDTGGIFGHYAWVSPYAFFADTGIEIRQSNNTILRLPVQRFPNQLIEWSMTFDDWTDSIFMTLKEWRKATSAEPGGRPVKPWPVKFLLNLDDFEPYVSQ